MNFLESLWDFIWLFFLVFAFAAYLMTLFVVIADLFRDRSLNGWWKAVWVVFLIFVPFITVLVYLIARGAGMAERSQRYVREAERSTEEYIRTVAGVSAPDEIAKAKALLDQGTITPAEYATLKSRALQPN